MKLTRRRLLSLVGPALSLAAAPRVVVQVGGYRPDVPIRPPSLKEGDTIGLIAPGGAIFRAGDIEIVRKTLGGLGLRSVVGRYALERRGYLAGRDADRAADVNRMFADSGVDGILALRGGWGCNRILPLLDYDMIRNNPKILMGYSDITSLLVALYARCGLVSFHGPVGISTWNAVTLNYVRRICFHGETLTLTNPRRVGPRGVRARDRIHTISPGKARGRLVGGNLSVLASMLGSTYLPAWDDAILFLEDTDEDIYRIDRMMTQLALAGILSRIAGLVFGKCTNCEAENEERSLTIHEVLADHLQPLGIPSWFGAMIGHISEKFTVPVGVLAEIDSVAGSIRMLEPAVT